MFLLSILTLASALAPPITFCSVVQQPKLCLGQLIVEVSRSHTHLVGLLSWSYQLVAEATLPTQHKTETESCPHWGLNPKS